MHSISNENISRLDEISQEVGTWKVSSEERRFEVTVIAYFRENQKVEYGGCCRSVGEIEVVSDACGDFFKTQDEALNDLLRRVAFL